jgi:hypothetical protein
VAVRDDGVQKIRLYSGAGWELTEAQLEYVAMVVSLGLKHALPLPC